MSSRTTQCLRCVSVRLDALSVGGLSIGWIVGQTYTHTNDKPDTCYGGHDDMMRVAEHRRCRFLKQKIDYSAAFICMGCRTLEQLNVHRPRSKHSKKDQLQPFKRHCLNMILLTHRVCAMAIDRAENQIALRATSRKTKL